MQIMSPEHVVGFAAIVAGGMAVCWRILKWFGEPKRTADPWDEEAEARLDQPDAVPLCTRCVAPYDPSARFCSHCGLPADSLVPWSPYLYVFALGDVLVTGTSRRFPVNWLTVTGFILVSAVQYSFFAPIYWVLLFRNVSRQLESSSPQSMNGPAIPHPR